MTAIFWFRRDLRLADNRALRQAAARGPVLPVYILEKEEGLRPLGGASRWWLNHSLERLSERLGGLVLERGKAVEVLIRIAEQTGATSVHWNRNLDPDGQALDQERARLLAQAGLDVSIAEDGLLHRPGELKTGAGGPFKVFTPFWKACQVERADMPVEMPELRWGSSPGPGLSLDQLDLLPDRPNWASGWEDLWQPGEEGATARLEAFVSEGLPGYGTGRDHPSQRHVSRLSPHLHFGEISPRQILSRIQFESADTPALEADAGKFLSELGWREFSHHLLHHYPDLPARNWKHPFDHYPWEENRAALEAWQRGMTGYPLVDAGMRELWRTGYMHNRVRMVAASFLVKHLRIHWKAGEAWFWDTLVDADAANNAAGWQWVAGSGADAAPYFRIFNPVAQGRKFDPDGAYIRRWCPELGCLDNRDIHAPFEGGPMVLEAAGIRLGRDYPVPIVDHGAARQAALSGYERVKAASG